MFYNSDLYGNYSQAVNLSRGIMILAFFIKVIKYISTNFERKNIIWKFEDGKASSVVVNWRSDNIINDQIKTRRVMATSKNM